MSEIETPLEKWTSIGVLDITPENRKEAVANALEFTYKTLSSNPEFFTIEGDGQLQTISFPIIARIVNVIDLTEDEILEIITNVIPEAKKVIKQMLEQNDYFGAIDYESMFAMKYIDNYILNHKKS